MSNQGFSPFERSNLMRRSPLSTPTPQVEQPQPTRTNPEPLPIEAVPKEIIPTEEIQKLMTSIDSLLEDVCFIVTEGKMNSDQKIRVTNDCRKVVNGVSQVVILYQSLKQNTIRAFTTIEHLKQQQHVANSIQYFKEIVEDKLQPQATSSFADMVKKVFLQIVVWFSVVNVVAPGVQHGSKNSSVATSNKPCTLGDYILKGRCRRTESKLVCTAGFTAYWLRGIKREITHLRLVDWPGECINVGHLQLHYPELLILEFINSTSLKYFSGQLSSFTKIQKLAVHGMPHLWEISPEVIAEMGELREMNLRGNMLRHMKPNFLVGPRRLERVFLKGNNWDCSDGGLDWLAMEPNNGTLKTKIVDYYDLVCQQQLHRGKPLHIVMDIIKTIRRTCPKPCSCLMTHVVFDTAGTVIPLITVDCAYKQLKSPPGSLPPGTTTLRLEGNKINSIGVIIQNIIHNPQYKKLVDLYLDNNSISAVKELEGIEWFATFRVLSLRGNLLKQIPIYAFDKAFQANYNIMHVFLGNNPWRCDCHYIPRFQNFLLKYKRIINDQTDIRCAKSSDKKTSLAQINKITLGNICSRDDVELPISYLNIGNLVLLSLILIILAKFLYDRHNFKKTGKLPWLSSILP